MRRTIQLFTNGPGGDPMTKKDIKPTKQDDEQVADAKADADDTRKAERKTNTSNHKF